jgi:FlaG/FlaF family flagellin (archaellin)
MHRVARIGIVALVVILAGVVAQWIASQGRQRRQDAATAGLD